MLKQIFTNAFFVACFSGFAQQATIQGVVKNNLDNASMPYVSVTMDGTISNDSDSKGRFRFNAVSIGEHKITFAFLGYEKKEIIVKVSSESETIDLPDLKMKSNSILIPEVVVTSPATSFSYKYEGSNVIICSKEIELSKPIGTEEILKKVSGVNVSGDMGISNRLNVGIRGLSLIHI
jgi:hypothetical protein